MACGVGSGMTGGTRKHKHRRHHKKQKGGSMIADAIVAGTALSLYSFFTKRNPMRGGKRGRKTHKTEMMRTQERINT